MTPFRAVLVVHIAVGTVGLVLGPIAKDFKIGNIPVDIMGLVLPAIPSIKIDI